MRWDGERTGCGPRRPARPLRLVLACQRMLAGAALMALLERHGHQVTRHVTTAEALTTAIAAAEIDLAVIDLALALMAPSIASPATTPVVVLAPSRDCGGIARLAPDLFAGLVLESEGVDAFWHCLNTVAGGGRWFDPAALVDMAERRAADADVSLLTRRERDVARLVAAGQRNRAIAGSLGISEGTVKMHLHNVYAKLGLESRTQLAMDQRLRLGG